MSVSIYLESVTDSAALTRRLTQPKTLLWCALISLVGAEMIRLSLKHRILNSCKI